MSPVRSEVVESPKPESVLARLFIPEKPSRLRLSLFAIVLGVWVLFLLGLYFKTIR